MSNESTQAAATPVWFDISSRDPEGTQEFYGELFGWTVHAVEGEDYRMIASPDGPPSGGIGRGSDDSPYVGFVTYFPVDDLEAALERATRLGGTVVLPPAPTPMGRIAAVRDPEGFTVGLQGP